MTWQFWCKIVQYSIICKLSMKCESRIIIFRSSRSWKFCIPCILSQKTTWRYTPLCNSGNKPRQKRKGNLATEATSKRDGDPWDDEKNPRITVVHQAARVTCQSSRTGQKTAGEISKMKLSDRISNVFEQIYKLEGASPAPW